jgi:hypothetical protein
MSISTKSNRGTFDLIRCERADTEDNGVTTNLSVTRNIDGPLAYSPELDDFDKQNLGSTKRNGVLV